MFTIPAVLLSRTTAGANPVIPSETPPGGRTHHLERPFTPASTLFHNFANDH